ncbi:transglutaminase superfamily protein [Desulfobotulus alkaliphilus]|uniref:Transglutaminase superfamily protein n=1 Tax=Desulfobotulus alkaliphilus TaxID=622671 RepID=A0A562RIQ6_9BACT|nr:transglutaminase family protein [Desulfobotulus alkaliphilus]TWI68921.1 transglutaminase superfamily protein [Desulfobotulus alkaliphilus]
MTEPEVLHMEIPPNEGDLGITAFIDAEHPEIQAFIRRHEKKGDHKATAISLYTAVRDDIRYDPYRIEFSVHGMKASTTLNRGYGYCVAKAVVLAAALRAAGIPARLGFADVRNHLSTARLREVMGTDLFVYHGYVALFLTDRWIKVTPTFNRELCDRFGIQPLDFDGENDALLHPFDMQGREHMRYEKDHGLFQDLPVTRIVKASMKAYPRMMAYLEKGGAGGDFYAEAGGN